MNKEKRMISAAEKICDYLSRLLSSSDEESLSKLLSEGQEVYHEASQAGVEGADQMRCFYDLLASLDRSFAPVDFGSIPEVSKMPGTAQEAVRIASRTFGVPYQDRFPLSRMGPMLQEALRQAQKLRAPERILLTRLAGEWLKRTLDIYLDPSKYGADVVIELSPSLALDDIEEQTDGEWETVRFPVALRNRGPASAFDVKVQVRSDPNCLLRGEETSNEKKWQIDELRSGEIRVETITFQHVRNCELSVAGQFLDAGTLDGSKRMCRLPEEDSLFPRFSTKERPLAVDRNPYVLTPPVPKQDWELLVYERDAQLDRLLEAVDDGQGGFVAVKGLRRTGKTTLLRHFCTKVSESETGVLPVYIDSLIWRVKWEEDEKDGKTWVAGTFLRRVARRTVETARHKDIALSARLLDIGSDASHKIGIEQFQEFVHAIGKELNKPLLLVFDEADSLGYFPEFRELLLLCFKELVDDSQLMVVFAYELANPFWNSIWEDSRIVFEPDLRTELLRREATIEVGTKPAGLDYTPLAKEYLWRVTGGYPALVQLLCHHLIRDLKTGKRALRGAIRVADLKHIVRNILLSKDDLQYIDYLRHGFSLEERRLLITLIRGGGVKLQTGELRWLYVDPETASIKANQELRQRFLNEWAEERKKEEGSEGDNSKEVWRKLRDAAQGLKTKKIIDFYDDYGDNVSTGVLRLRVGFLDSFLRQ